MRNLLTVVASLGLAACVGGIDQPAGPTDPGDVNDPDPNGTGGGSTNPQAAAQAKVLFVDTVFPIVSGTTPANGGCGGTACHTSGGIDPQWIATDSAQAYATAVGFDSVVGSYTATSAPILTRSTVEHHKSVVYSQAQIDTITAWLAKEIEARTTTGGGTTPPPGPQEESPGAATDRLVKEWSGCMTQANFETADMRAWGNVTAGGSACKTCHGPGYGQVATDTTEPFFPLISTNRYYMSIYFRVELATPITDSKVVINDRALKGVGLRLPPHQAHPGFNPTNNNGYAALLKFYTATAAAKTAGTCGPSKLLN
jgi:hypothetical protein